MHGLELDYIKDAYLTNWMSTVGENIDSVEKEIAKLVGCNYAVGLSSGTAALHMCIKLAGERFYGQSKAGHGMLEGHKVFCSDMTFSATVNPVSYESGEAVFIGTESETWNMDPIALEKAFKLYPDVKIIVIAHLYGTPGKIEDIRNIANQYGAVIIEDAAESLGAIYKGRQTGTFGDYAAISFNGNKIITGSSGGMFLTNSKSDADKVRKWSTQSRENAPWYQHKEIGYNYRMSNVIAGVIRGQIPFLEEHIAQKKAIWNRYKEGLRDIPVLMNPWCPTESEPNFWLSCMTIDNDAMCNQIIAENEASYSQEHGKSCPMEILGAIASINAECRPIWKPMHLQPLYHDHHYISGDGTKKDVGEDIFNRGLCLPSDNKMTPDQQDIIINIIKACFE